MQKYLFLLGLPVEAFMQLALRTCMHCVWMWVHWDGHVCHYYHEQKSYDFAHSNIWKISYWCDKINENNVEKFAIMVMIIVNYNCC